MAHLAGGAKTKAGGRGIYAENTKGVLYEEGIVYG
jgi:hypothetical protein